MTSVVLVLDTHALLWYTTGDPHLGSEARRVLDEGAQGRRRVLIPSIVLIECAHLLEKRGALDRFLPMVDGLTSHPMFSIVPLDEQVVRRYTQLVKPRESHDRIIVATAKLHSALVVTKDPEIREVCETVW